MSTKADLERAVSAVADHVHELESVPRDLHHRVEQALHHLTIAVRELVHLPVADAPVVSEPAPVEDAAVEAAPEPEPVEAPAEDEPVASESSDEPDEAPAEH